MAKKVPGKAVSEAIPGIFLVREAGLETAYQNGKCTATDLNAWIHWKCAWQSHPATKKNRAGFCPARFHRTKVYIKSIIRNYNLWFGISL